jgi:SAM-dependent methyltransferase
MGGTPMPRGMINAMPRPTPRQPASIRSRYESLGAERFYREEGDDYRNPHEQSIGRLLEQVVPAWQLDLTNVLDLAAGSGEVTLALRALGARKIVGIDPFTFRAYAKRTGNVAQRFTFAQIAVGGLRGRRFSLIVCSFALHLCEASRLPGVVQELSQIAPTLLLIMPHKRPVLRPVWGWNIDNEMVVDRVRARLYSSMSC